MGCVLVDCVFDGNLVVVVGFVDVGCVFGEIDCEMGGKVGFGWGCFGMCCVGY